MAIVGSFGNRTEDTLKRGDAVSHDLNGRPSSLDVLLQWVTVPGNAARWQEAVRKSDGSRQVLANEIYDLLLVNGINHRTPRGAESKLRALEGQFDTVQKWLKDEAFSHYKVTKEVRNSVLRVCPVYPKIDPLLRSARQSAVGIRTRASCGTDADIRFRHDNHEPAGTESSGTKRIQIEQPTRFSPLTEDARDTKVVANLQAEPNECREFFKLELQVKRDQAICARAKARKELLDIGMSRDDVDRLLPLELQSLLPLAPKKPQLHNRTGSTKTSKNLGHVLDDEPGLPEAGLNQVNGAARVLLQNVLSWRVIRTSLRRQRMKACMQSCLRWSEKSSLSFSTLRFRLNVTKLSA
ncbi:unnamed protein product [Phytophthora lilii]|uniref:Unnamed protein product n=1 Tax=Phytophthora lilii TaxID=2077276 RepID=A0A9W6TD05_9STRA|nr:unnamed protein product [Phytophthora lilii]